MALVLSIKPKVVVWRQHFGLGGASIVDELKVTWPSGAERILTDVSINQILSVSYGPSATVIMPATTGPTNASSVDFSITFNKAVVNFNDAADLTITHTGTAHGGVNISGSGAAYTATVTGISGTGSFTLGANSTSKARGLGSAAGCCEPIAASKR